VRAAAAVVLAVALLSCASAESAKERAAQEDDVCEALFRHLFRNNASGAKMEASAFFLEVGEGDPSPDLLSRFAGHEPPVKAKSKCRASAELGVVDLETGEGDALLFSVGRITWESDHRVEVEAGYYEAGLSSAGYTYQLRDDGEGWYVESAYMNWIS
jgi:hypothetical protein